MQFELHGWKIEIEIQSTTLLFLPSRCQRRSDWHYAFRKIKNLCENEKKHGKHESRKKKFEFVLWLMWKMRKKS